MRALRLKTQFVLLVLAASVPLLLFAAAMGAWSARQHEENIEAGLRNTAAALAVALRRELDVATGMLETLTLSRALDAGDFGRFHNFAQMVGKRFDGWIVAVDGEGHQLVSTLVPHGTPLSTFARREWVSRALDTGRPAVSDLIVGTMSRQQVIALYVPVLRDGRAIMALGLALRPQHFAALLTENAPVGDRQWVLADGRGRIVGWGTDSDRYLGTPIPEWMRNAKAADNGVGRGASVTGAPVMGAVAEVAGTNWTVGVHAPADVIVRAWWYPFGGILFGGVVIVLASVAAALYLSRRLARPFAELADAADAIVTGTAPPPAIQPPAVREFVALRNALVQAGKAAGEAAQARERAAVAEAEARAHAHAEERLQFLVHELDHRVKNVLAAIQGLAWQTGRTADSVPRFIAEFQARLFALASVHDLLSSGATSASLHALIAKTISPYEAGERIVVTGDDADIAPGPATALAMAIHELATNAHKHGALSVPSGHVTITVRVDARQTPRVAILWTETGGPAVRRPGRRGFGTRLLEGTLADQLDGAVSLDFAPAGLSCAIEFPLGRAA